MRNVLSRLPRAEYWADRITAQHAKTIESIIETGRLLLKAKSDLVHGEWGRLFDDHLLPFGSNTAQRLMNIANHPLLANTAHAPYLPSAWTTLYELSQVPEPTLKNALTDGVIRPDMSRKSVKQLFPSSSTTPIARDAGSFDAETELIFEIQHRVEEVFFTLAETAQTDFLANMQQFLTNLERKRRTE